MRRGKLVNQLHINVERIEKIINEVKPMLRPTAEEIDKALKIYRDVSLSLERVLRKELGGVEFKVELEGSLAKGTALRGDLDIDIFILIRKDDLSNSWIKERVVNPLIKGLSSEGYKVRVRYASHPYINLVCNGLNVDVVPALWVESVDEIQTPVDRTPFHTRFIKRMLRDEQRDEVRLLKKFFKRIGVYGAEINIEGFSGYLCELLIIKYGSFLETIKSIIKWREQEVISINSLSNYEIKSLRRVFKDAALIFPDPVDSRRNAAASISRKSLALAMFASYEFLTNPSKEFFIDTADVKTFGAEELTDFLSSTCRIPIIIVLQMSKDSPPDNAWGEAKRVGRSLVNILRGYGFTVSDLRFKELGDYIIAYIELFGESIILPEFKLSEGPERVNPCIIDFLHKHLVRDPIPPWITEDGRILALTRRRVRNPLNVVSNYIAGQSLRNVKVVMTTHSIKEFMTELKKRVRGELIRELSYWLMEAVLKRPSWLSSMTGSNDS